LVGKTKEGRYERRLNDEDESEANEEPSCSSALKMEVASFSSSTKLNMKPQNSGGMLSSAKPGFPKRQSDSQAKLLSGIIVKKKK
jgi:hypothetical protein